MVAIIKKNFRLQNARDFLENLRAHPRCLPSGTKAPLHESANLTVVPTNAAKTDATATYSWTYKISNTVDNEYREPNSSQLKEDSILGLKQTIGTHVIDRNHYLFIGKTTPWTQADPSAPGTVAPVPELSPAPPNDTLEEERRVWDEMLGLKKITDFYTSLVVPRSDWDSTQRTIYRVYDDRNPTLYGPPSTDEVVDAHLIRGSQSFRLGNFYVLNSEYDLFVCLQTGSDVDGYATPSLEEPRRTQSPATLIDYSAIDGYIWKYITTIKSSDASRFATDHWLPIRTLTPQEIKESDIEDSQGGIPDPQAIVQKTAVPGAVLSFIVENAAAQSGSGSDEVSGAQGSYTTTHKGILTSLVPATPGNAAKAYLNTSAGGDLPSSVDQKYKNMHLYITSGQAPGLVYTIADYTITGANHEILLKAGENWDSSLTSATAGQITYEILPQIQVVSNGSQPVKLKPVVSNGRISSVKVLDSGRDATYVDVVVHSTSGKNNNGVTADIRAVLSPVIGLGADPEKDLGAFFVMLGAKLKHFENAVPSDNVIDLPVSNDYRQIGIIRNVLDKSGKLATENTYSASNAMQIKSLSGNLPFVVDEIITQQYTDASGNRHDAFAKILDLTPLSVAAGTFILTYVQNTDTGYVPFKHDTAGTQYTIYSARGGENASAIIDGLITPEIKKFSGEILYLENRRAILRADKQTEDIKAVIEF